MQAPMFSKDAGPDAEYQFDLVRSAIALLAGGGARRVTLVNIGLSEAMLREAGGLARAAGILLRIAPHGAASDITVEASG